MALTDAQQSRLDTLNAYVAQLELVVYSGAREIRTDAGTVSLDPEAARRALVFAKNEIARIQGATPTRSLCNAIRMDGNFADDTATSCPDTN